MEFYDVFLRITGKTTKETRLDKKIIDDTQDHVLEHTSSYAIEKRIPPIGNDVIDALRKDRAGELGILELMFEFNTFEGLDTLSCLREVSKKHCAAELGFNEDHPLHGCHKGLTMIYGCLLRDAITLQIIIDVNIECTCTCSFRRRNPRRIRKKLEEAFFRHGLTDLIDSYRMIVVCALICAS